MDMRTWPQLREQYGPDAYLVVCGSAGDLYLSAGLSEPEAVERYKRMRGADATHTIVCVPTERGRQCRRGWIADDWKWIDAVGTAGEGLAVERRKGGE